jgi:hypothetical protein
MDKERPKREYFSQAEAEAKVGQQIRSLVEFSGVPQGTTGLVASADPAGWTKPATGEKAEVYDVAIQWDLPRPSVFADRVITGKGEEYLHIQTGKPLVDWFTKDEYERFLEEVPAEGQNPGDEAFSGQQL